MSEDSAVKVCVRLRPLITREESSASENAEPLQLYWKADKKSIHQTDDGNSIKSFSFDRVFTADETTDHLYQGIAKPLVVSTVEGYNGTIFAYGQTSSGKTFTMMGNDGVLGVIPLAVEDVFQTIKTYPKKEFLLRVSYMEIYNETVTDLLVDSWKRKPLEVRETINKNIYVADLTEEVVTSPAQALAWIRKGEKSRHYGKTKMNQRSSRSHTIFRMILESRERSDSEAADGAIIVSHLNLVDLAGSERASQTGAEGARFKEGCNINRSLFTLGQVIKKLTDESQKGFTNYRDSKLTRILQNSLGGNAKTVIICTVTAAALDETLSTLQFASTAKKMKNDPHVTEVSDDGALLKRYRNEIVDLKRRLHEVSSVTQTTATEKEVLSQLLQEKDQLQREQEDKIRNLTKLLVTSSNLVPVKRKPQRRVTWGGKMQILPPDSAHPGGSADLSFAESLILRRKADRSCLSELAEEDEDFDAHWEVPYEPSDDMDVSQASVSARSFGDSPKDFISPDRICELSGKVSSLELQVEVESRQKEEAMIQVESLNSRVSELDLQLRTEAQHKQEATEKVEMLEFRVADMERRLEEQGHTQRTDSDQMAREFADSVHLCETLSSEKDMIAAERDYLKEEVGVFMEQIQRLEREKAAMSQELEEQKEMEEFEKLEERFRKDQEAELQREISTLKKASESSETKCLELQNKLEAMSEELQKKTAAAEELENMCGKDLVKEVAMLQRSLDDAEGVGRDTKKEWAFLRSQNIALEERDVTLTADHKKMEAEVKSLRSQLEAEKAHFKKIQNDLQKELNVTFVENTKLMALLDGKVPKSLIDSVELERTVTQLNKELEARWEAEGVLKAQLEDLDSLRGLPVQVDHLTKQVCELSEELSAVQSEKDGLSSAQTHKQREVEELTQSLQTTQEDVRKVRQDLSAAAAREDELSQRLDEATQTLESLRSDMESSNVEKRHLKATTEETVQKLEESERHRASLSETLRDMEQVLKELEAKLANSEQSRRTEEEISKELQQQVDQLTQEASAQSSEVDKLHCVITHVSAERDQLKASLQEKVQKEVETLGGLHPVTLQPDSEPVDIHQQRESDSQQLEKRSQDRQGLREEQDGALVSSAHSSAEDMDKLLATVAALTAERDQLKTDMQENVDMMIENQEELRAALEKNRQQKELIEQLKATQTCKRECPAEDVDAQLEEMQTQMRSMREELQSEGPSSTHHRDQLLHTVTSVTEERDQLQDIVEALRQDKEQLRGQLEDMRDTLQSEIAQLNACVHTVNEQKRQLEEDLHHNTHMVSRTEDLLKSVQKELCEQKQINCDLKALRHDKETIDQQIQTLTKKLQSTEAERDHLLSEKQADSQSSTQEMEKLVCTVTALTEDRDQLQDTVEALRQDKQQLRGQLEDMMDTLQSEITQLNACVHTVNEQKRQLEEDLHHNTHMASKTEDLLKSVQEELCEQKQIICDLKALRHDKETLDQQIQTLTEKLQSTEAERDHLLSEKQADSQSSTQEMEKLVCTMTALTEDRDQLQDTVEALRQDKQQLRGQLEDMMDTLQSEITQLNACVHTVNEQKRQLEEDLHHNTHMASKTEDLLKSIQEELCEQKQINCDLKALKHDKETIDQQIQTLTKKLQSTEAERDHLLSEKQADSQSSTQEMEKLVCNVTALTEDRDQLQDTVEALRQDKQQLRGQLEQEVDQVQQLKEQLQTSHEKQTRVKAEAEASEQLLSEANRTVGALREQLRSQDLSPLLQDSTLELQTSLRKFQDFKDMCSTIARTELDKVFRVKVSLSPLPMSNVAEYSAVCRLRLQSLELLVTMTGHLKAHAHGYKIVIDSLIKKDLAIFEERRLQDVLLCKTQAPSYSIEDQDFHSLWKPRVTELLDKRQLYLQKMGGALETLKANMASFHSQLSTELREREWFQEQLEAVVLGNLEGILNSELERRSALVQNTTRTLQDMAEEHNVLMQELRLLEAQSQSRLQQERSKRSTLLQALRGAPLQTELDLLKGNQQLLLQLQQAADDVKSVRVENEELKEAQVKANEHISNHRRATQLLQTELQDSRAQVQDKDHVIHTLKTRLQEAEKNASPSAIELETLKTKVFKMEMEQSVTSDKHQQEILKLTTSLNDKEESLRRLKLNLRTSQQQGDQSFLHGKDLHARLTKPRGVVVQSSIALEKTKLEEEVTQLRLKITELESLVSTHQAEVTKWRSRAMRMKVQTETTKPQSPRRRPPLLPDPELLISPKRLRCNKILDSPRKGAESPQRGVESPKVSVLNSPKSRFFDADGNSELLWGNCPKQFFDNSALGFVPEVSRAPDESDAETGASVEADQKEAWPQCPASPKPDDLCKTQ